MVKIIKLTVNSLHRELIIIIFVNFNKFNIKYMNSLYFMKKKLTIFGGSGFVGKSFIDSFINGNLSKFSIGELNIISRSAKNKFKFSTDSAVKFFNYDFSNNEGQLPNNTDYIINAVDSNNYLFYDKSFSNDKIIENIITLTQKKYKYSKTLYVSSGAVYGEQEQFSGFDESFDKPNFSNFSDQKKNYALSKYKFEKAYKEISNINCKNVIARCFTFIGSHIPLDLHFAIGNFYNSVIHNKKIIINSKKNIYRSYMNSTDLVDWLMTILFNNNLNFDVFNVGSEEKIEIENLAKIFKDLFNVDFERINGKSDFKDVYIPNIYKAKNMYNLNYEKNLKKLVLDNFNLVKTNV